jgi:hypothetical protein
MTDSQATALKSFEIDKGKSSFLEDCNLSETQRTVMREIEADYLAAHPGPHHTYPQLVF